MEKQFKRSFIGFRKKDVKNEITAMKLEYAKELKSCEIDVSEIALTNLRLKEKIKEIELKLIESKKTQQKITEVIYKKYMESCKKSYLMKQKYEEMVTYKKELLQAFEESNIQIKNKVEKISYGKSIV